LLDEEGISVHSLGNRFSLTIETKKLLRKEKRRNSAGWYHLNITRTPPCSVGSRECKIDLSQLPILFHDKKGIYNWPVFANIIVESPLRSKIPRISWGDVLMGNMNLQALRDCMALNSDPNFYICHDA
jgi:hypothetical protein